MKNDDITQNGVIYSIIATTNKHRLIYKIKHHNTFTGAMTINI